MERESSWYIIYWIINKTLPHIQRIRKYFNFIIINKNNIDQAKKFLSNGGLIKTLKDKYEIEPEVLSELVNE